VRLYDPLRPRLSPDGTPMLLAPDGTKAHVVPALYIYPRENGLLEIAVFLARAPNCASRRTIEISPEAFPLFLREWQEDPEECCRNRFAWAWEGGAYAPKPKPLSPGISKKPDSRSTFTLEDLI
jgi:hypothetical protein